MKISGEQCSRQRGKSGAKAPRQDCVSGTARRLVWLERSEIQEKQWVM